MTNINHDEKTECEVVTEKEKNNGPNPEVIKSMHNSIMAQIYGPIYIMTDLTTQLNQKNGRSGEHLLRISGKCVNLAYFLRKKIEKKQKNQPKITHTKWNHAQNQY